MYRSTDIKDKWTMEDKQNKKLDNFEAICIEHALAVVSPCMIFHIWAIKRGWTTNPTITSVKAKQANAMLDMLCRRALVFTAIIINRFNTMVKGQVVVWITIKAARIA